MKLRVVGDKEGKGVAGRGNSGAKWWDDEKYRKRTWYKYLRIFRSRWNQTCKNEGFNP